MNLLEPSRAHFNKRCTGVRELPDSQIQISFADGTTAEADILLGADGIRSNIRTFVVDAETSSGHANGDGGASNEVADVVRTAFTNTLAYRGLVPTELAKERGVKIDLAKRPYCFVGSDKVQPIFIVLMIASLLISWLAYYRVSDQKRSSCESA